MEDIERLKSQYTTIINKLQELNELHNSILVKVISVTDEIIKQQLQEEYLLIAEAISETTKSLKLIEKKYISAIAADWMGEFIAFYDHHFKESTLLEVLNNQGINLLELEKKYKLRPIRSISQKRELCLLLNEINRQIKIVDYQGYSIDIIGKYKDPNPIVVHVKNSNIITLNILKEQSHHN